MNIVRHRFDGGLIGEEQRWQSDLEYYTRSLVQASNMLPTPYGGMTRRPPLVNIGSIASVTVDGTVFYPSDARAFDFVYSATQRYLAIFVVYSATGEDDFTRIVVKDTTGTDKGVVGVPYTQLEVLELDIHQSNDTMWITHQNHFPSWLVRRADADWIFETTDITGGPFLDENEDGGAKLSVGLSEWKDDFEYIPGDTVRPSASVSGTASWIGTAYSMVKNASIVSDNPTSTTYGAIGTWNTSSGGDYAINDQNFCYRNKTQNSQLNAIYGTWYPFTYVQVSKAFSGSVNEGDEISILLDFVEEGGDDSYSATAQISEILVGTTYDYIKINLGWRGIYFFVTTSGLKLYAYEYIAGAVYPKPDIPDADKSTYQSIADQYFNGDVSVFRGDYLLVGVTDSGGAAVTPTAGNITKYEGLSLTYKAKVTNTDVEPGVDAGWDSVWVSVESPTESSLVQIDASGVTPFGSDDTSRILYVDKAEEFAQSGNYIYAQIGTPFYAIGRVRLITEDSWTGEMALDTSSNAGADWKKEDSIYSVDRSHNGVVEIEITKRDVLVRVRAVSLTDGNCAWRVEFPDGYSSIYSIAKYLSDNQVLARVLTGTETFFQSSKWALGAWGGANGYPGTVTVYENRLWYSGSIGEPFKHWGSVVDKYWNFAIGTFVTSAIIFQARADSSTRISWTEPKDQLFFGTDFGEYSAVNLDQTQVLSASNPPKVDRHTSEGSARIPAKVVGNALAYVSADKKRLKLLRYDAIEQDGYRSYDMTHMNRDVAGSGFVGHCLQRSPFPVLWLWTADGNAAAFTLDREHNVTGWSLHSTASGLFKSLCVIPDENGIDEVYAIVEREDTVFAVQDIDSGGTYGDVDVDVYARRNKDESDTASWLTIEVFAGDDSIEGKYSFYGITNGLRHWRKTTGDDHEDVYYDGVDRFVLDQTIDEVTTQLAYSISDESPSDAAWVGISATVNWFAAYIPHTQAANGSIGSPLVISNFTFDVIPGGWGICLLETGVPLFESSTISGVYNAVAGSGATGSVEIGELNYHIEKLDYSEAVYTDNLGGPVEEEITSIFEPTPLSRGPQFLDGNKKFQSNRGFIYVVKSNGGEVSVDNGASWDTLDYSKLTADGDGLYTGKIEFRAHSGFVDYASVQVRSTGTEALTVSAIKLQVKKHERRGQ